jgi:hypothetical protein
MSSVLERLANSSEPTTGGEAAGGLKASYLLELPPDQRRVMRVLLRHNDLGFPELCQAVAAFPEAERLTNEQLEKILAILLEQNWLIRTEVERVIHYKANFQRRADEAKEKITPKRKVSPVVRGVWDALEAQDSQTESKKKE